MQLQLLGVSTVGEFLETDLRRVFDLRGFGATTYANLKDSRDTLREEMSPGSLEAHGEDQFLYDEDDISTLGLTVRGLKALRRLKASTIRDFLRLDLTHVGHLHNFGEVTRRHLTETQARLRERVGFSEDTSVALRTPSEPPWTRQCGVCWAASLRTFLAKTAPLLWPRNAGNQRNRSSRVIFPEHPG